MKTLWLLRHAKSSWDDPGLADHDRPLAPRGRKAAKRIRRFAAANDVRPELVLCSTALRARATLELIAPGLGGPEIQLEGALYLSPGEILLDRVRALPPQLDVVMLVGHNPGLHELVRLLAPPGPEAFPTGALAEVQLAIGKWHDAEPGCGLLHRLVLPRSLSA